MCCEESASGASEGFGGERFSQGRGRGGCRHCLSFHSTTLQLLSNVKRYGGATRRRWRRSPGQRRPHRRSAAMRAVATKSLVIWPRACWSEGCFFGHWRSGTTFSLVTGGATRRAVRKHRAPKGALRRGCFVGQIVCYFNVRKHRAPKGALRRFWMASSRLVPHSSQKAPSAKRWIKTPRQVGWSAWQRQVRKHRAPKGALRQIVGINIGRLVALRQKAPSAKRCIKTRGA